MKFRKISRSSWKIFFKGSSYVLFCLIIAFSCEKDFSSIQIPSNVNYFPIKAGNYWLYDAEFFYPSPSFASVTAIGTEKWEIVEVNPDLSLFQINASFSGISYYNEWGIPIDSTIIRTSKVVTMKFENRCIMGLDSLVFNYPRLPCISGILRDYFHEGARDSLFIVLPYTKEGVYESEGEGSVDFFRFFTKLKYGVGSLDLRIDGSFYGNYKLNLIDYQIQQ